MNICICSFFLQTGGLDNEYAFGSRQSENGSMTSEYDNQSLSTNSAPNAASVVKTTVMDENTAITITGKEGGPHDMHLMTEPYGVPCMVEIFHFLCSLLNVVEHTGMGPRSNTLAFDEDVPLFALNLINSAIELAGPSICRHPRLLNLIQDELFHNLMQFGLSMSPLILSMVCSI